MGTQHASPRPPFHRPRTPNTIEVRSLPYQDELIRKFKCGDKVRPIVPMGGLTTGVVTGNISKPCDSPYGPLLVDYYVVRWKGGVESDIWNDLMLKPA